MCGICGVLAADAGPAAEAVLARLDAALAHRGPDGRGEATFPGGAFAHRRLAILDLSPAGAQPMWDPERRLCLTFNGEIYNFRELGEGCRRAGVQLRTRSDSEVILALFGLHGAASFDLLDGIFAFALHDVARGETFLVRDRHGVKPLYWAPTPGGLVFASELGAILRSGAVPFEVDRAALQAYLQLDAVPSPATMVRGVAKLPAASYLRVDAAGRRELRSLGPAAVAEPPAPRSLAEAAGEVGRLLERAVEKQLVSDVPLGVLLSGGLDSSLVAWAASRAAGGRVATFSVGFEDPSFDETPYFEAVAAALGTEHHREVLHPRALLELLPSMPEIVSEPLADGSVFPTALLARFTRRHVKVALGGDGADELFAGYPTYFAARLGAPLAALPAPLRRALVATAHRLPVDFRNLSFDFRLKKLLEGLHRDPVLRHLRWLGTFLPEELEELLVDPDPSLQSPLEASLLAAAGDAVGLDRLLRTDERFYLQDQCLVKVDRAAMASALEVRVPFLDPDLVAYARTLPPGFKLRGAHTKVVLRRFARGRLPAAVVRRGKKGFGAPFGRWFRGELRELLGDTLSPDRLRRQGFFRPATVERLLAEHWAGRRDHRKRLFSLLTFTLWHDAFAGGAGG